MTKIKICGLKRAQDIDFANRLLPEYIGFVFAPVGHRTVSLDTACTLRERLDRRITPVGVFRDQPLSQVLAALHSGAIDAVQLHGQEDEDYIARLRAQTDAPIVQAFAVQSAEDVARACRSTADQILLDNRCPGSGERFDWSLTKAACRPYFLAGGLSSENVAAALDAAHPFAVDVSSGVETEKQKDFEKMQAFVNAVRAKGDKE